MLHYNPQHVSSNTMLILRRSNFIITASGIVTLCKRPYSMPVESGLNLMADTTYKGADKSLAPHTSPYIFFMVRIFRLMLVLFYIQGVTGGKDQTSGGCSLC